MTNTEILTNESALKGFNYDGHNLKTFHEWRNAGYTVIRGQKAFLKTNLWISVADNKTDTTKFIFKKACLFTDKQVKLLA